MDARETADTCSPSPFPAWRLPKGRASSTDADLESSIASRERWEWNGGLIVVLGIAAAVVIAAIHPQYDSFLEQRGSAISDGLVAIGVVVEIKMGRMAGLREQELKRRANERVGKANDRAAQSMLARRGKNAARTELEAQLSRRAITKTQYDALQTSLGQVPGIAVVSAEDFESVRYAQQIVKTLCPPIEPGARTWSVLGLRLLDT